MTMNLTQATEGLAPLDPELQWMAQELADDLVRKHKAACLTPRVKDLPGAFCKSIADAVAERLGVTERSKRLSTSEATLIGLNAVMNLDPDQQLGFQNRVDLAARFVAAAARIRAVCPVSYDEAPTEYWPFGMAGGFCNPNKLSQLDA